MELTKYNEGKVLQNEINLFTETKNWYDLNKDNISNFELSTEFLERLNIVCRKLSDTTFFTERVMPQIQTIYDYLVFDIGEKQTEFDELTCE